MEEIGLTGGGPRPPYHPKPMERVMEGDRFCDPTVEKARDFLPEDLDKTNTPEVPLPFWN